jgi:acyl carrier protein
MQPAAIVVLSNLPLTPNGKIDRKSLPAPEAAHRSSEQSLVEPRTALEQVLAGIWASVLGVERVGVHDNFFEMGGHSLLVIQVIVRIRDAFRIDLPFRSLFTTPTAAGLGEAMLGLAGQSQRIERTAELLLALAQLSDNEVEAMLTRETTAPVAAL